MASRASFTFDADALRANLRNAGPRLNTAIGRAMEYQARRSESFMRANAPWTDRTSNARNGLKAIPQSSGTSHSILLTHSMPYGIWLEVRWSGKYGIIPEAVRQGGQELMGLLNKLMEAISA